MFLLGKLTKNTILWMATIASIAIGLLVYASIDRTVVVSEQLVITPGSVSSDSWTGVENTLISDANEYSLYQEFSKENSSYIDLRAYNDLIEGNTNPVPEVVAEDGVESVSTEESSGEESNTEESVTEESNVGPETENSESEETVESPQTPEPESVPVEEETEVPVSENEEPADETPEENPEVSWGAFPFSKNIFPLAQAVIDEEVTSEEVTSNETSPQPESSEISQDEIPVTEEESGTEEVVETALPETPADDSEVIDEVTVDPNTESLATTSDSEEVIDSVSVADEVEVVADPAPAPAFNLMDACGSDPDCKLYSTTFTDFTMPEFESGKFLTGAQLRLSLAAKTVAGTVPEPQRYVVEYTYDENEVWEVATIMDIGEELSNSLNGGYFLVSLEKPDSQAQLSNLKVRISYQGNISYLMRAHIDGVWLEVTSSSFYEETEPGLADGLDYERDLDLPKFHTLTNLNSDIVMGDLPAFTLSYSPQEGFFSRIANSIFGENEYKVERVILTDSAGDVMSMPIEIVYQDDKVWTVKFLEQPQKMVAGKFKVEIAVNENDTIYIDDFEFYWGVLAVNTTKTMYYPDEKVTLNLAALTDQGDTICDATLNLTLVTPSNTFYEVPVEQSGFCGKNNVTDIPDYLAYFNDTNETGRYTVQLEHVNKSGEVVHKIQEYFEVRDYIPFDIERTAPTRIYPPSPYTVKLNITANRTFVGDIVERVPRGFVFTDTGGAEVSTLEGATLLTWKDVTLNEGEKLELSYIFDAPDISPYLYLLGPLDMDGFKELRQWQIASDALNNIGWFEGTRTIAGTNLNTAVESPLQWATSSVDTYYFSHSTSTDSNKVTLRQPGDYFISVTVPHERSDANNARVRIGVEVKVNGVTIPEGVSRSGYSLGNPTQLHTESSTHVNFLLTGVSANDYVEVFTRDLTTYSAADTAIVTGQAAMFIEYVPPSTPVFAATATSTVASSSLNTFSSALRWTETRQDNGFVHSDSVTPENIVLSNPGTYIVHVNIPYDSTIANTNVLGRVRLDGVQVAGGVFSQGYLLGSSSENDNYASIHWSGIVMSTTTNQVLTITTENEAASSTALMPTGFVGSIYIENAPTDDAIILQGTTLTGGAPNDWSPAAQESVLWTNRIAYDAVTFTHSTTSSSSLITINEGGDYLLTYADALTTPGNGSNPRITVEVNGVPVIGAQTKTHITRNIGAHNNSSASLVYLLEGLSIGQVVRVRVQEEATNQTVDDVTPATLTLTKKVALNERPIAPTMFNTPFDNIRLASTTPFFQFQSNDPDGSSRLQYEFAISTSSDFATATIRTSGVDSGFTNTASTTDNSPFLENNKVQFQLQGADELTDLITYYWRVRARDVTGSNGYGDWSTTQSLTVNMGATIPNWYQTYTGQFTSNTLIGAVSSGEDQVQVDAELDSEIMVAYGDGTNTTPRYRLWDGVSWGTQLNAIAVGGTINWVRTAAGITRDEYVLATIDQSAAAYVQVYNSTTTSWGNRVLLSGNVNAIARRGIAVGYESISGDAMAVSCSGGASPVYRTWNGASWTATSSITVSSINNCNYLEIASDPESDEMILVIRDSGASIGNNYEALVWDGSAWVANRVIGSVQNAQLDRAGMGVAYEASGQQAIVTVTNGTNPNVAYTTWNGSSFTPNATQPIGNDYEFGRLKADIDTDDMALCYVDEDSDAGVLLWNGGSWQTFQEVELTANSNTARPISCEFETTAGRTNNLMVTYSDGNNMRYQPYSGSWPVTEQTITGIEDSFWVQTERANDGTILVMAHDDAVAGDEIESSYWNGTNWSVKESVVPNPSSVLAAPYETFDMSAKQFRFQQGVVTTRPINFSFVPNRPTWGDLSFSTTEPFGTDVKVKLKYSSTTSCDSYISNVALPGNSAGFDVASSTLNISGLSTTTYSQICLEATITTLGSASASLDDWSVTWQRQAKMIQNNYRWFANGSFLTPTDPWPAGVTDILENTPMQATEAVNINDVVRLRMSLQGSNIDLASTTKAFKLQYAEGQTCTPLLAWTDVGAPASTTAVWRGYQNAIVGSDWLNAAWTRRLKITVEGTLVIGAQTDFPVYVNLDDLPDSFFNQVQSDGDDIRVTTVDGISEVPFELVSINTSTKKGELHFKANLASTTDTDFYIYYSNPSASGYSASATYGRNNVWTNAYEAVYHLETSPASNLTDSTSNGRTLTTNGGMLASQSTSSVLGQGVDFDGVNDRLTNAGFAWTANPVTVTLWNNVSTAEVQNSNAFGFTASGNERLATHAPWSDNTIYWDYGTCCTPPGRLSTNYTAYRNKWTHVGLVSQGGSGAFMGIYLDGSPIATAGTSDDPNVTLTGLSLGSTDPSGGAHHNGRIDEFRIASVARSAGWLMTERTNQSNPTGFYALSAEELIGDGRALPSTVLSDSDYAETYEEQNPTALNRSTIAVSGDAEWDFVLQNYSGSPDTEYCFRMVYSDDSTLDTYADYPRLITNSPPPPPTLVAPFDNEQLASSTPWFEFFTDDALSDEVSYEVQVDNNYDFSSVSIGRESNANFSQFTNLLAPSERGLYTTGNTIQFIANSTLGNGTYYWRVRAKDDNGSGAYSEWSTPYSFTIASTSITTWMQTTGEQFATNDLLEAVVSTSSNDVGILTGFTEATTTSTVIDYDDRDSGNAWGRFLFTHNVTSGSIRYHLEYNTGGDIWALIPDVDLPGNESGFTSSPVSIISLDTTTYNEIRLLAVLAGSPTLPRLLDWRVEWGETIEVPTAVDLFDNAKTNSTLPQLSFYTTDPQSSDLQYEVQLSTTYDFAASSTFMSGVDAGFTNLTNATDTSPFFSGHTIRYTVQSALSNGVTYWWRVRARDPGDTNIWSNYNSPQSFTVDTASLTSTWYQTTGEQFATDDLVNIETVSGGAQITSVITEVMTVYGEGAGQSPQYRLWNGTSWSSPESADTVDSQIRWTQVKAGTTRPEYVLGTLGTDLDINFQVYDSIASAWGNKFEIYTESVEATKRRFDLSYETNSGDLVAVACAGVDALYSVWNGTSWSATSSINLANANNCEWVQLTSDPVSDEIIALFRHTSGSSPDFQALVWNGSSWGNSTTFGDISNNTYEGMSINYEASGNQALMVTANNANNSFLWSAWNGTSWTTATATAVGNDFWWSSMKRDDGSDRMALCYVDGDSDIGVVLWSGSAWNAFTEIDQNNNDINGRGVDCEYQTTQGTDGDIIISYSDGTLSRYQTYSYASSSFSIEANLSSMNDGFYMQSVRGSDGTIHTYTLDDASTPDRYDTSRWNGTNWSTLDNFSINPSIAASPFNGSITMAPQTVPNFTEGSIRSTAIPFAVGNSPRWERVRFTDTTPGASEIRYRVYYETATSSYALIPDAALSGNSIGFTNSPIDISAIDRTIYSTLKLDAELICSSGNCPSVQDWSVEWSQGITVSGSALGYDQITAVSSGTVAIAVNGVLQVGKTATLGSGTTTEQVVFDTAGTSTFAVPVGVTNVTVKAWGAGGGAGGGGTSNAGGSGGGAGFIQGNITTIPGENLSVSIGGGGVGGALGIPPGAGGGGGYSGVFRTTTPLAVAGGGGGGGGGTGGVRYVGVGTACAVNGANCTPTVPAGTQVNDVYISVMHSYGTTSAHTCTTNCGGWTEFSTQSGTGAEGRLSVWWYRQTGAVPANPTFAGGTDSYTGRIWAFRGVATSGNPYAILGSNTSITPATTTFAGSNLNSPVADAMVVHVAGTRDDNTWGPSSGSCTVPNSVNASFYTQNANGSDNSISLCYRENPLGAAGSLGVPANLQAANGPDVGKYFTFALRPNSSGIMAAGRGGVGGGTSGGAGVSASTTVAGGGGTQTAGGSAGGGSATIGSAYTGGDGDGGTGGGAGGAGGLNGGGTGGTGNLGTIGSAGGGGGAGYYGGGGASRSSGAYIAGAGGGGGSSYIDSGASATSTQSGSTTLAGNNTDPDYVAGVGVGNNSATSSNGANGGNGRVVISWSTANVPGQWTIPNVSAFAGDVITVFMQGASGTAEAVGVTKYDGVGDISGLQLSARHLTIGSDDAPNISNANLGLYDSGDTEDVFFSVSGGNILNLCAESTCGDARLRVLAGSTYTPGADGAIINFQNNGTFAPATNTLRVSGAWQQMDTFIPDQSTIIFTATTSSSTLVNATSSYAFHNVTFGENSGTATWNLTKALDITGSLRVDFGTLARATSSINLEQNLRIGAGGLISGSGTTTFDGTGSYTWTDLTASTTRVGKVVIDGITKTITLASNVAADSVVIGDDDTFNASGSGYNINVYGGWTNNNAFIPQSGTVTFVGTSSATIARGNSAFNNLTFSGVGGSWSFSSSSLALNGNLTIATGTVTLPTGTTTIGSSFANTGGTFLHNNGEVRMTSNSAGRTITQRGTAFNNAFYDLVFSGSGAWSYTEATASTTRNMNILGGTVTLPSGSLSVGGDFSVTGSGAFAHNNGELYLSVTGSNVLRTNGSALNNVRTKGTAGVSWYNSSWSKRLQVTVNSSQVPDTVTNFPVYVNLSNLPDSFFTGVKADGGDIRMTTSDGVTEVPLEIVSMATTTKTGELHFKAPSLSSTTNSSFYIYYGNASAATNTATSTYGRNNVWSNGYEAVYHLQTSPVTVMVDSTSNGRNLTSSGGMGAGNSVAAVIGNGVDFDGINDALTNAGFAWTATAVTVTAWNNVATGELRPGTMFGFPSGPGDDRLAAHAPYNDSTLYWDYGNCCAAPGRLTTSYASSLNKWTHIGLVSQGGPGSFMGIYLDGALAASNGSGDDPAVTLTSFSLGSGTHEGRVDEFRIASVARTGAWIGAERNNQASSTAFYTVAAEELRHARVFTDTNATILGNLTLEGGGDATFPSGVLSVGGSFDNDALFSANNGTVRFNSTAGAETIAVGTTSSFATLEFNSVSGNFTVTENATATTAINLTSAQQFTLQSGLTLATLGSFTNATLASSTTWTGSTLSLLGPDGAINLKSHGGDAYGTILTSGDTDMIMWNSTATTYQNASTSSIYSADHGGVDGSLNIYGDYVRSTGTEFWSYATDFDGSALTGSTSRQANVRIATSSRVGFVSSSLNLVGGASASSTIDAVSGTYGLSATNTTITAQYFTVAGTNASGLQLNASTTLSVFQDGYFTVVPGRTGITISSTTVSHNPAAQYQRISFATTTAGAASNVTMTGTSSSFVWFRLGTGNLYGEAFDANDGNPGSIRFDDSSNSITISGIVYADDGVTPLGSPTCNGTTPNVRVVVNNGSYTASTTCNAGTGAYTLSNVTYLGDPKITVYLNTNGGVAGTVVTKTPTANITNMNIYAGRVITRHQDVSPLSIADMTMFDNDDDSDIKFVATTTGSTTLRVLPPNSLFVFATTTFAPGGNINLQGNASTSAVEGTLQLGAAATFTASGTESHLIGGRLVLATTSVLTSASSTFTFNATTTGKSITSPNTVTFNVLQFTGVGGGWNITAPIVVNGGMTVSTGTVTGTNNITVVSGSLSGNGTLSLGSGTTTLNQTSTLGGTRAWTFANLVLGSGSVVGTTTLASNATTTVLGRLTIANAHFLVAGSSVFDLAGAGTVFVSPGTFVPGSSTVRYSGNNASVLGTSYYNLILSTLSGSSTFTGTGSGLAVTNNLQVGGNASTTVTLLANDPLLAIGNNFTIGTNGTFVASDSATTTIAGNYANTGSFISSGGRLTFTGSGAHTIAAGSSTFAGVTINGTGTFNLTQNATSTVSFTLLNHSAFTVDSGRTLSLGGTFTNTLGGAATTFTGSTLSFYGGGTKNINTKSVSDVYATIFVASSTNVKMWNSSSTIYSALGGIYSQDHAGVDGRLNIYGAYTQTSGNDYWSADTDFDGTALLGSARRVDVGMASGSSAVYTGGSLEVIGTSTASTTITNQGTGTYGLTIGGTASTTWNIVALRNMNAQGVVFTGTPIVNNFSRTDHLVTSANGTGLTVNGTVIDVNQAKSFTGNVFASSTGGTSARNVTATGTTISSWRFTNYTGLLSGEAYDNDPAGDPGYITWDDSAALITVSGNVYSDEGVTVSPACDGVTSNIRLVVANNISTTSYSTNCNGATGLYSIASVAFSAADTVVVYIDGNARKAVTVTADPVSSISNMHLYENRVIVRHENTSPLSIAKMSVWDSSDDADVLYTAVDAGTDTLALPANQKLLIWNGKTFEPNGNVTVAGGGAGGAQDGTLEAQTNAVFRALGAETHIVGGSFIFGTGAVFTAGLSTTTFTTTGSARTIDVNNAPFYNVAFTGAGSWTVSDSSFTANRSITQTSGTLTYGTGTTTVGASFNTIGGTFVMNSSVLLFNATNTGHVVRFNNATVPMIRFEGTGGAWSMTDTNATTTGSFIVASGTVTLPSGNLGVARDFTNQGGTIVHNTADLIMSATSSASLRTSSSSLFAVRLVGSGPFTMTDSNLTLLDSLSMTTGSLNLATGTVSVAGDFLIASGTVSHASGTVLLNATSVGKTVNFGNNPLYNVVFGSGTGGWNFIGNATTTNNFYITGANSFTKAPNTTLSVGNVFTNTVGGANTTWATSTLRLYGNSGYTINTKSSGGDVYGTLEIVSPLAIRAWNSSAATTSVLGTSSFYSQDHAGADGTLNIYGNLIIATTTEHWSYATDFDGSALVGIAQRQVNVRLANNATTTVQSGSLQILGTAGTSTTIANQGSGSFAFSVIGGTINAQYYSFANLNQNGLTFTGTPTITNLANGYYVLGVAGGSLITLDAVTLDANASKIFAGVGFATTSAITGFNVNLTGSTSNAWRFSGSYGNLSGEAFDVDGMTGCGSIRFDNSSCLLTQQTHYRWRNDDGGEGAPNSEWYNTNFDYRQRVRIVNSDATAYASTAVKINVAYDSNMQSDFDDLRFTSNNGLTVIPHWIERYTASNDATVWVRVPNLPASDTTTVFMYYGSSTASSTSSGTSTFTVIDDFEDNNISEYSGDAGLFQTDTTPVYGGTYALEALNKSGRTTDGIFRTAMTVSQGQIIRWMQYINTTAGSGDEACTLFGVQSPGTTNNNYAVCLEQFGIDRMVIAENVSDNDVSGTVLASTTVTYATGWYEVEVDWRTNNSINAYLRTTNGTLVAYASTTDSSYTTGGVGFTFWFQNGSWDSYTARARGPIAPNVYFGAEQTDGGATWSNNQNVAGGGIIGQAKRLRFAIENSGLDITNQTFQLEYASIGVAPSCEAVANAGYSPVPNQASCAGSPICAQTSSQVSDNDATTDHLASTTGTFVSGKVVESPSSITSSLNLDQNRYTELEYVITPTINATTTYCLRVTNAGTPLDFYNKIAELSLQFDPVFSPFSLNNGQDISLTTGTTTSVMATGTITDLNGYLDLVHATSTIYRSGAGASCTPNSNNCFVLTTENGGCSFTNCSGSSCTLTCRANVPFHAEPTDSGTYIGQEWLAYAEAEDSSGGYDLESAIGVQMLTLRAMAVDSLINYGTLSVQSNTGSNNSTTSITNLGNVEFNVDITGTDLTDGSNSRIPANQQKVSTTTFAYSACVTCQQLSTSTPITLGINLAKPVVVAPPVTTSIYWGIAVPLGINSVPHSGVNLFTPIGI